MFETSSEGLGWVSMIVAITGFGFCCVPWKVPFVQKAKVDPMLYQLFYSFAIFVCNIPPLAYTSISNFTYWGIVGAACWVPSSVLGIYAIKFLGLAVAQGLWSVGSMIIGFLWGILYFKQEVPNIYLCILGLVLLCCGILLLATSDLEYDAYCCFLCTHIVKKIRSNSNQSSPKSDNNYGTINERVEEKEQEDDEIGISTEKTVLLVPRKDQHEYNPVNGMEEVQSAVHDNGNLKKESKSHGSVVKYIIGLACCLLFSVLNGSMMVPSDIDNKDELYLFEYGVGVLIITPFIACGYFMIKSYLTNQPSFEKEQVKAALIPGLMSGVLWSFGNYGTLFAIYSPIGLAIAVPLSQTALVISGLSGMLLFRELKGVRKKIQFFVSTLLLIIPGCFLLAIFGTGENST